MTDATETVINSYSYSPYGRLIDQQESLVQPFKFVGQYGVMTEANGLYYMRARYYDPTTGRFISEDPTGFEGGQVNLYAYVGGNPVLLTDPNGECPWCIVGAIFGGATSAYGAWMQGKDGWDIAKEAAIGAAFGAIGGGLATTGKIVSIGGKAAAGASVGAVQNAASQSITINADPAQSFSWSSFGISTAAGALGGLNTFGAPNTALGSVAAGFSAAKWGVVGAGIDAGLKRKGY